MLQPIWNSVPASLREGCLLCTGSTFLYGFLMVNQPQWAQSVPPSPHDGVLISLQTCVCVLVPVNLSPVTSPQGDFLFGGLSPVVQPLFAQCNSNTSSPETCHEAYLAWPERSTTDSFICLETGQSILSVTFFFFKCQLHVYTSPGLKAYQTFPGAEFS